MEREYVAAAEGCVPMYGEPDCGTPLADEWLCGMRAKVEEWLPGWVRVETEYGYEGYVEAERLVVPTRLWERAPKRQVKALFADVLAEPMVQSKVLASLPRGARVAVLDELRGVRSGWCPICLPDGLCGYMQMSWLAPLYDGRAFGEARLRVKLVEMAQSYLGTAYRWGGKTPAGIDCSGLTFMCYWMYGVSIYRNAEIREGFPVQAISPVGARPGDLLYFPGHVAMLLDENSYIHATGRAGSDGVVVNSLRPGDPRYREDLAKSIVAVGTIF